jgi:hypothetical protein
MKATFQVISSKEKIHYSGREIKLVGVWDRVADRQEDSLFPSCTPLGTIEIHVFDPEKAKLFECGSLWIIDLSKVDKPEEKEVTTFGAQKGSSTSSERFLKKLVLPGDKGFSGYSGMSGFSGPEDERNRIDV